jgi:hypothetical protein
MRNKIEDVVEMIKTRDLHDLLTRKDEKKKHNSLVWVLAIIGAVAAIAAIAYAVYRYMTPDYFEDFDDYFDDFDDYFFEDDDDDLNIEVPDDLA